MVVLGEEAAQQAHERDLANRRFFKGTTRIAVGFSSEGAHNAPAKRVMLTVSPLSCRAEVGLNYEVVPNLFNIDKSAVDCLWWYASA